MDNRENEITLEYLEKIDECYIEALEDALAYRGNFKYNTTERLTELLYMFKYRTKQEEKKRRADKGVMPCKR